MKKIFVKVKKESFLITEKKNMICIVSVGILVLIVAFVLEFCELDNEHVDFFINILLGAAASAVITFVTLYVPYKSNKRRELIAFEDNTDELFFKYSNLIEGLTITFDDYRKKIPADWIDTQLLQSRYQVLKESLLDESIMLKSKIDDYKMSVNNLSFTSKDIENINEIVSHQIYDVLYRIIKYYNSLMPQEERKKIFGDEYIFFLEEFTVMIYNDINSIYPQNDLMLKLKDLLAFDENKKIRYHIKHINDSNNKLIDAISDANALITDTEIEKKAESFEKEKINKNQKH